MGDFNYRTNEQGWFEGLSSMLAILKIGFQTAEHPLFPPERRL